jgi:hypothetical protein
MLRKRWLSLALASALGSVCGCSTTTCNSCENTSFMSRVTGFFRSRPAAPAPSCCGEGGVISDGPVLVDPGFGAPHSGFVAPAPTEGPGFTPLPQSSQPPLATPRPISLRDADRMPLQP